MNLALMRAISRILRSDAAGRQTTSHMHPSAEVRLVTAIVCILLCAMSRNAWFTITIFAVEFILTALKPAEKIGRILKPVVAAAAFAAIFSLPAVFMGSPGSFGTIVMKVAESVLVLSRMNEEISWKETTGALRAFHVPEIAVAALDQTVRFLVILGRFSDKMLEAVSLRRVGEKKWNNAGTGGIIGTTFLKSQKMASQTAEAMVCRGFTGEMKRRTIKCSSRQRIAGILYLLLIPLMIVGFIYTQRLM